MAASPIDQQTLANVVGLACRAPSLHNSQPWHLIAEDGALRLFLEPHRVPRATDQTGREAFISCGALLDHLRVAAAAAGWNADVARARADAILARRTDRLPFAAPAVWPVIEPVLRDAVDPELATLYILPASARPQVAEASRLAETERRCDNAYHAELSWWTAPFEFVDGVPSTALAATSERQRVDVARDFPLSGQPGRRPAVDGDEAVIAVLSTDGSGQREALGCGEAMSAVLLEATLAGLATCPVTHITEWGAGRNILRALTGGSDEPQLLIRLGQAPAPQDAPPVTPRRPLADVLEIRH